MQNNNINAVENQAIIEFGAIPAELRILDRWICWKHEMRNQKPTKVPYDATLLKRASCDAPSTWTSFEGAKRCYLEHPEFDGVGFVFSADDPFCGIDIDDCLNENGGLEGWAIPILDLFMPTYCEISPSGKGLKLWVKSHKSEKWQKADGAK